MTATRCVDCTARSQPKLYVGFELGWSEWKLAFGPAPGVPARLRTVPARDLELVLKEIAKAKERFGLPANAPVLSCYEAGRDGFWLHRYLLGQRIENVVVDSSSIEVSRRARRAKSDRLDAAKLLTQLLRYHGGEERVWSVVVVPSAVEEDKRQLHRELMSLKEERTKHVNRIKGLLAGCGLVMAAVDAKFVERLGELRTWDGQAVPWELRQRLLREYARWQLLNAQIGALAQERLQRIRQGPAEGMKKVRHLLQVSGVGVNTAWLLVHELFGWRRFANRRQLGALAGLAPSPYQSGAKNHEQGISKAGNPRLRAMLVEISWGWLRWQPRSRLSRWFQGRFGRGTSRYKRVGIVALARKLLVALWRYVEMGEVPEGVALVEWQAKLKGRRVPLAD
jgi:transposase